MKRAHNSDQKDLTLKSVFAIFFALLLNYALFCLGGRGAAGVTDRVRVSRLSCIPIRMMLPVISYYLMFQVLFSSLQFKFAQCYIWMM